ncbi:nuclear transport factor 2 family protein [Streptomyces sp. NPDC093085]|uniref:nuclear transport factor 2 family protein n=1 Tax=Streptomyces sp. NPDC093085 TaxID=3155068 RepID=UPI003427FC1D
MNILESLYARWNDHDVDGVLAHFSSSIVYHDQAVGFTFHSPGELGAFIQKSFESIPDLHFEVTSSLQDGSHFAGEALMLGTFERDIPGVKATGRAFTVHYGIVGDHRDGKITRIVDYWNAPEFTA